MSERKPEWRTPSWIPEHIELYLTEPDKAHMWDSSVAGGLGPVPTLLLTTKGRRSGAARYAPLIYRQVEGGYAVIASKGGFPDHPAWYLNLVDNPDCEVRVGTTHFHARARTAESAERMAIWARMARIYPPYDDYQARTDREIPVVILEPAS